MEKLTNLFTEEALSYISLVILLILAAIGYIPAYLSDRAMIKYNKIVLSIPKKKTPVFAPKPTPWVWKIYFVIFCLAVFIGVLKINKEHQNETDRITKQRQFNTTVSRLDTAVVKLSDINLAMKKGNIIYDSIAKTARVVNNTTNNYGSNAVGLYATTIRGVKVGSVNTTYQFKELKDPTKYKTLTKYDLQYFLVNLRHVFITEKMNDKNIELYYVHDTNGSEYVKDIERLLTNTEFHITNKGFVNNNHDNVSKGISTKKINNHIAIIVGTL